MSESDFSMDDSSTETEELAGWIMAEFEASSKGLFVLFLSLAFVLTSAGALASTIIFDFVSELETTSCWFSDTLLVTDIVLSRLLLLGSALDCLLFSVWIVFSFWIDELEDLVLVSSTVEAGVVSFWKNIYFLSICSKLFYYVCKSTYNCDFLRFERFCFRFKEVDKFGEVRKRLINKVFRP